MLLAISAHAATVWDGPTISFTKTNYANPLLAVNQDRLTANVWITRGSAQGLFNANTESRFNHFLSPAGTEWANGSLENYATLSYTDWNHWARGVNPSPPATVGVQAVVHLIPDDIYLSVKFTSWTAGSFPFSHGGGFAYLRSTPVPEPPNAVTILTPNLTNETFSFSFVSQSGYSYFVEAKNSVELTSQVITNLTGTGGIVTIFDSPINAQRIYRVGAH
jgi:hypothetical protein